MAVVPSRFSGDSIANTIREVSEMYLLEPDIVLQSLRIVVAEAYEGAAPALIWEDMSITVPFVHNGVFLFKNFVVSEKKRREISRVWERYLIRASQDGFLKRLESHFALQKGVVLGRVTEIAKNFVCLEFFHKHNQNSKVIPNVVGVLKLHLPNGRRVVPSRFRYQIGSVLSVIVSEPQIKGRSISISVSIAEERLYLLLAQEVAQSHAEATGVRYQIRIERFSLSDSFILFHTQFKASESFVEAIKSAMMPYGINVRVSLAPNALKWQQELCR